MLSIILMNFFLYYYFNISLSISINIFSIKKIKKKKTYEGERNEAKERHGKGKMLFKNNELVNNYFINYTI